MVITYRSQMGETLSIWNYSYLIFACKLVSIKSIYNYSETCLNVHLSVYIGQLPKYSHVWRSKQLAKCRHWSQDYGLMVYYRYPSDFKVITIANHAIYVYKTNSSARVYFMVVKCTIFRIAGYACGKQTKISQIAMSLYSYM